MITKLRSRVKLTTTILISLIVLNTHISLAETKNPFAGNYMGANLGRVSGDASSVDKSNYNGGNVGDYSPDGQFTTFNSGQPVHTQLSVSFLEDRIITKSDIEAGA